MGTDGLLTFFSLSSRSALIRDLVLTRPQTPYPSRRLSFSLNLVLSLLLNQEPGREASERGTWAQRAGTALPKDGSMLLDEAENVSLRSSDLSPQGFCQELGRGASERGTWAQRAGTALPKDGSMLLDEGPRAAIPLFIIFSDDGERFSILFSKML